MCETIKEEKNDEVIKKFRDAFIFEAAWELESNLEGQATGSSPEKQVRLGTVIFNKALGRTAYAARTDLLVSIDDVKKKQQEVWG